MDFTVLSGVVNLQLLGCICSQILLHQRGVDYFKQTKIFYQAENLEPNSTRHYSHKIPSILIRRCSKTMILDLIHDFNTTVFSVQFSLILDCGDNEETYSWVMWAADESGWKTSCPQPLRRHFPQQQGSAGNSKRILGKHMDLVTAEDPTLLWWSCFYFASATFTGCIRLDSGCSWEPSISSPCAYLAQIWMRKQMKSHQIRSWAISTNPSQAIMNKMLQDIFRFLRMKSSQEILPSVQ